MRLLRSSLLYAAAASIAAASAVANVYLYDHDASTSPHSSSSETIDAETSRLILAQRLGLSQFHTLKTTEDEALRRINDFGGRQRPLFAAEKPAEGPSRVMIVVEGVDEPMIPALANFKSFSISPAPHPSDSYQLWSTFSTESSQLPHTGGLDHEVLRALTPLAEMKSNSLDAYNNQRTLLYVKSVATAAEADVSKQLQALGSAIQDLYTVMKKSDGSSLSIVFMPSSIKCSKHATNAYGANLSKRAAKAQREQILSEAKPSAANPSNTVEPTSPFLATKVLKGAVPTCFSSKHNCETGTNNCTSHGSCVLKFTAEAKNKDGSMAKSDCYGCACKAEVKKNKVGSKTTSFGGAACNKKDIVMPFWLVGGSSILLIFIVSWGLGLLYSMGSEELPSVIGAGVSGPKAKGS